MTEENKEPKSKVAFEKEVLLSTGEKAQIFKGKGKHSLKAQQLASGDPSKVFTALMSELVTIDGKKRAPEDYEDMDMKDFNSILTAFSDVNF